MDEPQEPKEPYEAPEVVKVNLVRDELAVTGCKSNSAAGRFGPCLGRGLIGACRDAGS
jgi:hypothetical protein